MKHARIARSRERHLEQALAEHVGERPAPLGHAFVRRDAAAMAHAAARLDRASRPVARWPLAAAAIALLALGAVWSLDRRDRTPASSTQEPSSAPQDAAQLIALAPQLTGISLMATSGADGRKLAPGPERLVAIAEPAPVAALREALASATASTARDAVPGLPTTWYFGSVTVAASLSLAPTGARLQLPQYGVSLTFNDAATAALTAAVRTSTAAIVTARRRLQVATARELLMALGSDRTIEITASEPLLLDDGLDDGRVPEGSVLRLREGDYGMPSPTLQEVRNLHLRGLHGPVTVLVQSPRADVLRLIDCENITLENLVLGHAERGDGCQAPVLSMRGGSGLRVLGGELFGCGAMGLDASNASGITMLGTRIHSCSVAILALERCSTARFELCRFEDTTLWQEAFRLQGTTGEFLGCVARGMRSGSPADLFAVDGGRVNWRGGAIRDNRVRGIGGGGRVDVTDARVEHNEP